MEQEKEDKVIAFLYSIREDILDFFSYILSNFKKRFINLYKKLIFCFMMESKNIIKRESYKTIASYISQIISLCHESKKEDYNEYYEKLANNSSSIILLIAICRFTYNSNNSNDKIVKDISYIIDDRISSDLGNFLDSICYEEDSFYIYSWILKSYINYFPDILNLSCSDYMKVRERVKKALSYIQSDKVYFNIFIWNKLNRLFENVEKFLDETTEKNITFYINIWGRKNIEDLMEKQDKETFNYYLSIDRINKLIEQDSIVLLNFFNYILS